MKTVVTFDLDGTLLRGNSSYAFSRFLYSRGVLTFRDLLFCIRTYFRCLFKNIPLVDLHKMIFRRLFDGKPMKEVSEHIKDFVTMHLDKMLYLPAIKELQRWKEQGARLILLSGSPDILVKQIAQALGLCEAHGTEYAVDQDGNFVGLKKVLDGAVKAAFVKAEGERYHTTQLIAYSDHVFDLPLLEYVRWPIVVNPGRRLKKIARRRGWPIL